MEKGRKMSYSKWVIAAGGVVILTILSAAAESIVSLPGCPEKCGNLTIPYPFGIGNKCSYDKHFTITCNQTAQPSPKPILGENVEVLDIALHDAQIRISNYVSRACYGVETHSNSPWIMLRKFTIDTTLNKFVATGCDTMGSFVGKRHLNRSYWTGCMTKCFLPSEVDNGTCSGTGCCETKIPRDVHYISVQASSFLNYTNTPKEFTPCSSAFVVAKDSFIFGLANLTMKDDQMPPTLPVVYDWTVGNETCADVQAKRKSLCCEHCECLDSKPEGYRCSCLPGYSGNPYLKQGCQKNHQTADKIVPSVAGSFVILLTLGVTLQWHFDIKHLKKMRDTFFKQNGGLILQQRLGKASADLIKTFTVEELQNATGNYCEDNVIPRGRFGKVYKGKLPNNQVVAVKKSLKVDPSQAEQFINEILELSQVNSKNVVKLLGCCLENEVPLLVYEFTQNESLYDHLHDERKALHLTWDIRLRIATEVAEVLAHFHTVGSIPIIHRDMKSMNILLDENFTAKVSDFGASRDIRIDQEQVATMVQGTRGYLDPEYMQIGELNEKSDVYSFGVVLVELLTRRKVISSNKPKHERTLASYFLSKFKEQQVLEIIDEKIMSEGATEQFTEQLMEVATLARRCLDLKGEDRPNMKEVTIGLGQTWRKFVEPLLPTTDVELSDE